ncbi:MAG: type VI secretion system protein TssA [Acidobacteria bacterium]|nr:MAG: type VI secretion system protein TssA [Acidobacteriota bacterium]
MSTDVPPVFDLERLLEPISPERPAGEPLRYDGTYDRIREARREDDPRLSQGIYQSELKRADWAAVERVALEALETRTKDLQIAAWLLEAWLQLYGFAGAAAGLRLMSGLCENFWEQMYPEVEGGDTENRVAPVVWVNEKLSVRLKQLPVSSPQTGDVPAYSYADWESACHLENLARKDPKAAQAAEARGAATTSKFNSSVMLTERGFYAELFEETRGAHDACEAFERLLEERCGRDAPSLRQFREALAESRRVAAEILQSRPGADYEAEAGEMEYAFGEDGDGHWSPGAPIRSRAEAYQRLAEAADYLLRTEPHSPTPYLVRRAVEWGAMSLNEILQQIVRNDGEMQELNRLLRLAPADEREK